ncbi:MAG: hypothetical protein ACFCU4_10070 [Puniceicoccaceae bacterium]
MAKAELSFWSERQRLQFVERILFWRGWINRRDLIQNFGISPPQATNDLVRYVTMNAGGCNYNLRTKRYEAAETMEPILVVPDFLKDQQELGSAIWTDADFPFFCEAAVPQRSHSLKIAQALCRVAQSGQSIEVAYFSVSSGKEGWRRISPRTFGSDGLRVHVRAFCHQNMDFRDFVIGRIKEVRGAEPCGFADRMDADWHESTTLLIQPNPELREAKKVALEMDYGMVDGMLRLTVRRAFQIYTARRLGFVKDPKAVGYPLLNEMEELIWVGTTE